MKILLIGILLVVAVSLTVGSLTSQTTKSVSSPPEQTNGNIQQAIHTSEPDIREVEEADTKREATPVVENGWGLASWYGRETCKTREYGKDCKTANGEVYLEGRFTLACAYRFNLGQKFRFTFEGKTAEAYCNDRGAFEKYGRQFDFSRSLFEYFAPLSEGVIKIQYERIE